MADKKEIAVYVLGRVGVDFSPLQPRTRLEDVLGFERSVGGFAGNVVTGLTRLGVPTAILSAVGDDGFGRYVRNFLVEEGADVSQLLVHPTLRTALSFFELWPPDTFPLTLYRVPTCPDWEIESRHIRIDDVASSAIFVASGTGLARQPSRETTNRILHRRRELVGPGAVTVLDLDWREMAWSGSREFGHQLRGILPLVGLAIGGLSEFEQAGITPTEALETGPHAVVVKRGPAGASLVTRQGVIAVPGIETEVVNGLGAGDAFLAAFVAAIWRESSLENALEQANAAGAIVAGRHGCSVAMPTQDEIEASIAGAPRLSQQ